LTKCCLPTEVGIFRLHFRPLKMS